VRHGYGDDEVKAKRVVEAVVEVLPEFEEGLRGVEEFSHLILVTYLHKFRGRPLVVAEESPRRARGGGICHRQPR